MVGIRKAAMKPEGMHLISRPIRVFLVDDHEVVRRGVAELLEANDDIEVVGEASSVMQARNRIPVMTPDVAIIDLRLPDGSGLEVCEELRDAGSITTGPPAFGPKDVKKFADSLNKLTS